ncbi:hypothetical protein B0H13DRAFT_1932221 [Mycena leptocephala]|nr:hypothetical protein B0H13DRAFT_1932221 [Mycena leptocephala]
MSSQTLVIIASRSIPYRVLQHTEALASEALEHFKEFEDSDLKCRFYNVLVTYYERIGDISSANNFCGAAISLALSTGNNKQHSQGLHNLAWVQWHLGDYSAAQVHAIEAQRLAIISQIYTEKHRHLRLRLLVAIH